MNPAVSEKQSSEFKFEQKIGWDVSHTSVIINEKKKQKKKKYNLQNESTSKVNWNGE